jgi:hypothetical protein
MARRAASAYQQQAILPGFEALQPIAIGDPLGRCYTPDALSVAVLAAALSYYDEVARPYPTLLVEPSVGGGSFLRAAEGESGLRLARTVAVDLDPAAPGLAAADHAFVGDWPERAPEVARLYHAQRWSGDVLVVGNPPFDSPPEHTAARDHVRATLEHLPDALLAFILPLGYLGVAGWDSLLAEHGDRLDLWRIVGRPWPERIREVALYVWRPRWHVHTLGAGGGLRRLQWRA